MTKAFSWLPFLLILGACATPPTGKYSDFKVAPTISVASTTVSTWTETPAEDHLLPNSQVFISGRGSNTAGWLGPLGGLFGAMIGTAVDRSQNEAAVASATAALTVKFHEAVTSYLRNNVARAGSGVSPKIVEPDVPADVQLLPYARFEC